MPDIISYEIPIFITHNGFNCLVVEYKENDTLKTEVLTEITQYKASHGYENFQYYITIPDYQAVRQRLLTLGEIVSLTFNVPGNSDRRQSDLCVRSMDLYLHDQFLISTKGDTLSDLSNHLEDVHNLVVLADATMIHEMSQMVRVYNTAFGNDGLFNRRGENQLQNNRYSSIYTEQGFANIISILYKIKDQTVRRRYIERIIQAGQWRLQRSTTIFDEILTTYYNENPTFYHTLRSRQEQIALYLELSKESLNNVVERVSDEVLDFLKSTTAYQHTLDILKQHDLGISQTQQFNTLQAVGLFGLSKSGEKLFNLSDMGSGKTLMTVEAIYLLDLLSLEQIKDNDAYKNGWLPSKHILAPALSQSAWLDTFKLFYDIETIEEGYAYHLKLTYNNQTYQTKLFFAGFTLKQNGLTVHNKVPIPEFGEVGEYLIVDEVHQLSFSNHSKRKFFTSTMDYNYHTFFLSGTLSNLKTTQWFNLAKLFDLNLDIDFIIQQYGSGVRDALDRWTNDMRRSISASIASFTDQENPFGVRSIDIQPTTEPIMPAVTTKETLTKTLFNHVYAPYRMELPAGKLDTHLNDQMSINLHQNVEVEDAANFSLFYKIVGSRSVTANAEQIMEELFDRSHVQNQAQLIETKATLTREDLKLLKEIYTLIGSLPRKTKSIAYNLSNEILNLSDGLAKYNIYEMINRYAKQNMTFLDYLAELPVDFLERLASSRLIESPNIEDTEKFKVLKKLMQKHADDTLLIVVNDYRAMKKLGEALDIPVFTKQQTTQDLEFQEVFDEFFTQQDIVIAPQHMMKSSLNLIQANVLIQYQLNTEVSDIIQTQNRINRIGQTRETHAYYIATDQLQNKLIQLFLESYQQIRVAHKGIVELFTDLDKQVTIINNYLDDAFQALEEEWETPEESQSENLEDSQLEVLEGLQSKVLEDSQLETPEESQSEILEDSQSELYIDEEFNQTKEQPAFEFIIKGCETIPMSTTEKVVGITFREQPDFDDYNALKTYDVDGIPALSVSAVLVPEPTNPYDAGAIAVLAGLKNGKAAHIGYLSKQGQLYHQVDRPTLCQLEVINYEVVGLNNKVTVSVED